MKIHHHISHAIIMATVSNLLRPTLHIEVLVGGKMTAKASKDVCEAVTRCLLDNYNTLHVGQDVPADLYTTINKVERVMVADYTGPCDLNTYHKLDDSGLHLDVVAYQLKSDRVSSQRRISQSDESDHASQARVLALPHVALDQEWNTLIYDDALPSLLLRYMVRMLGVMKHSGLNLRLFNWNRLCLLHGPPGSGKSTLCRALAQKLSIRLADTFPQAVLVEVNMNAMLSKYFGESSKLIAALFERIHTMAQSPTTLVCVIMDEVETIAGSREKASAGGECGDGVRATNQLLTALDRMRVLPNIIVLCSSNFIGAVDLAFLDRVDIKQLIPSPSTAAIYNIFRSCLNELVSTNLIHKAASSVGVDIASNTIATLAEMHIVYYGQTASPSRRVWDLAEKCEGFSGRTLRRLPILGLAMTWGGTVTLEEAVTALEAAVEQEFKVKQTS
jgi:hypothetical protein